MGVKSSLDKLQEKDIWSLMLFVMYKSQEVPEYSALSELSYILDRKNLLRFCEFFGGSTIKVPTIDELELYVHALLLYQYLDIEHLDLAQAVEKMGEKSVSTKAVQGVYNKLKRVLQDYSFSPRVEE